VLCVERAVRRHEGSADLLTLAISVWRKKRRTDWSVLNGPRTGRRRGPGRDEAVRGDVAVDGSRAVGGPEHWGPETGSGDISFHSCVKRRSCLVRTCPRRTRRRRLRRRKRSREETRDLYLTVLSVSFRRSEEGRRAVSNKLGARKVAASVVVGEEGVVSYRYTYGKCRRRGNGNSRRLVLDRGHPAWQYEKEDISGRGREGARYL